MTITLSEFRRQAAKHGICEMAEQWDKCGSNKQRIDLALTIRGIEYLADAIRDGWGISPDEIVREFKPFLGGRYIHYDEAGYTTSLFCREETPFIEVNTTAALVIGYEGEIRIPRNRVMCEIYAVNSKVSIIGEAQGSLYLYDSTCDGTNNLTMIKK